MCKSVKQKELEYDLHTGSTVIQFTLTGVMQLLSKCSVFSFSGGKAAPNRKLKKVQSLLKYIFLVNSILQMK